MRLISKLLFRAIIWHGGSRRFLTTRGSAQDHLASDPQGGPELPALSQRGLPPLILILAQFRQQTSGRLQICGVSSFHELLEDRLQQCPTVLRSAVIGPQSCQIDGIAQFPTPSTLATAAFERLHEASFRFVNSGGFRGREKSASLHT
jgi:hypothetical protein